MENKALYNVNSFRGFSAFLFFTEALEVKVDGIRATERWRLLRLYYFMKWTRMGAFLLIQAAEDKVYSNYHNY